MTEIDRGNAPNGGESWRNDPIAPPSGYTLDQPAPPPGYVLDRPNADPYAGRGTPVQSWRDDPVTDPFGHLLPRSGDADPFAHLLPAGGSGRTFERPEDEALYQDTLGRIRAAASGAPQMPQADNLAPDNSEAGIQRRAKQSVINQRQREAEQKAFDESRAWPRRIGDALLFALDLPARTVTGGQYGNADIAEGLGQNDTAAALRMAQGDFARANESGLEVAKQIGDASLGIPMLSTMGAPLSETAAAALRMRGLPAMARAEEASATRNALTDSRLEDLAAFQRAGVRPFGPAFTETGTAGAVKQLSEAPIVGAPVRNALIQSIEGTRDAGNALAGQYGQGQTLRDAGEAARGGIQRNLEGMGQAAQNALGEGTAQNYRDAGIAAQEGLERFRNARSGDVLEGNAARNMSDRQLSEVASTPARDTSIKTKQDALYERAWRNLPEDMQAARSGASAPDMPGAFDNTRRLLLDIAGRNQRLLGGTAQEGDAALTSPVRGGIAGRIVQDIMDGNWQGDLQAMRDVRSNFRRLASGVGDTEGNTLQLSDYRRIQSTMTQDMIGHLQRVADARTAAGDTAAANRIGQAIHDFRRADQFTRASAGRLEALEKLYGASSAEGLSQSILKDMQGAGKGNEGRLNALRRSLSDEEWSDVAGGILGEMGRPAASVRGLPQEAGFSANALVDNLAKLSPQGRAALFSHSPELRQAFEGLESRAKQGISQLERLYGAKSPEEIGGAILKDAEPGSKGNLDRLNQLWGALNNEERGNISAAALREMGRPVASARGHTQEAGFSVQSAITRYNKLSPEARQMLFGGGSEGRQQAFQDFIRVANRMANFEALANTSRSATNAAGMTGLASIFFGAQQLLMGHPAAAFGTASVAGGMYGFGKLLTSPAYVRWLTRAVELSRNPRAGLTLRDHARELARLAASETDPATQAVATALAHSAGQTAKRWIDERRETQSPTPLAR